MAYIIKWLDNTGQVKHTDQPINEVAARRLADNMNDRCPDSVYRLQEVKVEVDAEEAEYTGTF